MPRRRRVYVIRLEDLLHDPPPPSRLRPVLRTTAYTLAIIAVGALLVQLLAALFPDSPPVLPVIALIAYALILLLFFSLAKRINHVE